MIIFDLRYNKLRKVELKDVAYLAPEQYYEVFESPDDNYYHEFDTNEGKITIVATDTDDFFKKMGILEDKEYYIRTRYGIPSEKYKNGLKYFKIKE